MTTLITGASGGFGSTFATCMKADCPQPVYLSGRRVQADDHYVRCDVRSPEEVHSLIAAVRPSLVYHVAGSFADDFEESFATNVHGTKLILDSLLEHSMQTRVVLVGSAAEYGLVTPDENPISETRAPKPVSTYGLTKSMQTQLAHYYAHRHGSDVVVARVFNLIAPGLSERLFVGRVEAEIRRYKAGEVEAIELGSLEHSRDFLEAEQAAKLLQLIAERGLAGEAYNVGSGRPRRVSDLLDQLLRNGGLDDSAVRSTAAANRLGYDVPIIYADMTKTLALRSRPS